MNIVGLDVSFSRTGVARSDGNWRSLVPPQGIDGMRRISWIRGMIACEVTGADLVVIEGFSFGSQGNSFLDLAQLGGVIRFALFDAGIPFVDIAPATLKKYATGYGRADKPDMVEAARVALGYLGHVHDEADAMWLREMALDWYGVRPVPVVSPLNRESLHAVRWPHIAKSPRAQKSRTA